MYRQQKTSKDNGTVPVHHLYKQAPYLQYQYTYNTVPIRHLYKPEVSWDKQKYVPVKTVHHLYEQAPYLQYQYTYNTVPVQHLYKPQKYRGKSRSTVKNQKYSPESESEIKNSDRAKNTQIQNHKHGDRVKTRSKIEPEV